MEDINNKSLYKVKEHSEVLPDIIFEEKRALCIE